MSKNCAKPLTTINLLKRRSIPLLGRKSCLLGSLENRQLLPSAARQTSMMRLACVEEVACTRKNGPEASAPDRR